MREAYKLTHVAGARGGDAPPFNAYEKSYAADGQCQSEYFEFEGDDDPFMKFASDVTRPSIHMPRWASRLTLELTDVRVERLQDMEGQHPSESDAIAEGVNKIHHGDGAYYYSAFRNEPHPKNWCDPTDAFRELWEKLNGNGSWDLNPWVWVLSFKVHHANVDAVLAQRAEVAA